MIRQILHQIVILVKKRMIRYLLKKKMTDLILKKTNKKKVFDQILKKILKTRLLDYHKLIQNRSLYIQCKKNLNITLKIIKELKTRIKVLKIKLLLLFQMKKIGKNKKLKKTKLKQLHKKNHNRNKKKLPKKLKKQIFNKLKLNQLKRLILLKVVLKLI